jgi:molecular chaperone GrpE
MSTKQSHSEETTSEQSQQTEAQEAPQQEPTPIVEAQEEGYKAQFMRVGADFANYKRRVEIERTQWIATGQSAIMKAFLPIIDDIERALAATSAARDASETDDLAPAVEGFELIEKNLKKVLADLSIKEIDCSGAFDPHFHEALMQTASESHESGDIVQVLSRGYIYKDTVLRHAKVSVAQ